MIKSNLLFLGAALVLSACGDSKSTASLTEAEQIEQFRVLVGQSITLTLNEPSTDKAQSGTIDRCNYQTTETVKTVISTYKTKLDIYVKTKVLNLDNSTSKSFCDDSYVYDSIDSEDVNQDPSEVINSSNFKTFINAQCAPGRSCTTSEEIIDGKRWFTAAGSQLDEEDDKVIHTFSYAYLPNGQSPWLSSFEGFKVLLTNEATLETVVSYSSLITKREQLVIEDQFATLKETLIGKTHKSQSSNKTYTFELVGDLLKYNSSEVQITTNDNVSCNLKVVEYIKGAFKVGNDTTNYISAYRKRELDTVATPASNALACQSYIKDLEEYDSRSVYKYEYLTDGRVKVLGIANGSSIEEVI